MTKKIIFFLIFFTHCYLLKSQLFNLFNQKVYDDTSPIEKINADLSLYFHTGIKGGYNFSIEYPINRKIVEMPKWPVFNLFNFDLFGYATRGTKLLRKQTLIQGNIDLYFHLKNHTGAIINIQLIRRRIGPKNGNIDLGMGVGLLRTFLPTTYKFTEDGIEKVFLPGRTYITNHLSFCYGKQISFLTTKPFVVFVRPSVYLIYPYNHLFNVGFAMEWGVRLNIIKNPYEKN